MESAPGTSLRFAKRWILMAQARSIDMHVSMEFVWNIEFRASVLAHIA
jgi:hypothetical protein